MNEFEILIRYFRGIATHPFHSAPRYHEVGRWTGFIVQDQVSRSDQHVNVSRRAGASLNAAAKFPVRTSPEAVAVHKSTHERAFEGEKRDDNEQWERHDAVGRLTMRLNCARLSRAETKLVCSNHRLLPCSTGTVAARNRSNRLLNGAYCSWHFTMRSHRNHDPETRSSRTRARKDRLTQRCDPKREFPPRPPDARRPFLRAPK